MCIGQTLQLRSHFILLRLDDRFCRFASSHLAKFPGLNRLVFRIRLGQTLRQVFAAGLMLARALLHVLRRLAVARHLWGQ